MDSQLNHKIHLELLIRFGRPVWVLFVYLRARSAASHHTWEPIFVTEQNVSQNSYEGIKNRIEG